MMYKNSIKIMTDNMKFKAVIFDLDGTLLDTLEDLADSMNSVLEIMGFTQHTINDYKVFVGKGLLNLVTQALPPESRTEENINSSFTRMLKVYGSRWDVKTHPYKGIEELLDELTARKISIAILSNKVNAITQSIVEKYFGRWKFEAVFGERDGVPRKPDPAALFEIAEIMKIRNNEILCLGDSGSDITAAINAGMYPVGALWGFRTAGELLANGAAKVISEPGELVKLF